MPATGPVVAPTHSWWLSATGLLLLAGIVSSVGAWLFIAATLAPSAGTMKLGQEASTPAQWAAFTRKYRAEMNEPAAGHALDLIATLSHTSSLSVGCYCADEARWHRSVLRELLASRFARFA